MKKIALSQVGEALQVIRDSRMDLSFNGFYVGFSHKSTHVHYEVVCPPERFEGLDCDKVEDIITMVFLNIVKDLPGSRAANWYAEL